MRLIIRVTEIDHLVSELKKHKTENLRTNVILMRFRETTVAVVKQSVHIQVS
jgi:hypothetical protein